MEFLWSRDEVPPVASNPLTSCPTGGRTGRRPPGRRRSPEAPTLRTCPVLMDIEQVVPRLGEEALDTLSRPRVADEIRHSSNAERRRRHALLGLPRQPRLLYRFVRLGEGQVVEARGVEVIGQVREQVGRYPVCLLG